MQAHTTPPKKPLAAEAIQQLTRSMQLTLKAILEVQRHPDWGSLTEWEEATHGDLIHWMHLI